MRLYFATDIHGSETCWRKFLNAGAHYKADVIVLGGDMTGKALVPVINDGGGRWHATLLENRAELTPRTRSLAFEDAVIRRGYYPFRTDPDELRELHEDEPRWHALFNQKMLETVQKWMDLADERLAGTGMRAFCCPGNDDQFEVDEVIEQAKHVELGEGRVVDMDGFQMASTGWANRTPWDTYREEDEPDLKARHRQGDRAGDGAAREDGLQLPLPAVPLRARRRARADGRHDAEGRRPRREAGRLDRRARGDRGAPAGALGARPHPRGPRQLPHRPNALH